MIMRMVSVLAALAVLIGVPVAGIRLLGHHAVPGTAAAGTSGTSAGTSAAPPPGPLVTRYPAGYAGIVSNNVARFDASCRCRPNAATHYVRMGGPVSVSLAKMALAQGAVPLLELEPYGMSMAGIAAGHQDGWLTRYARAVARLRAPVLLSFAPEGNGDWYGWGFQATPAASYVAAWQHVVSVFRRAGAPGVRWVWIVNREFSQGESLSRLWPGSSYVNMVGIDGYFTGPHMTFAAVFGPTVADVRKITTAPIVITETAAAPAAGKQRAIARLTAGITRLHLAGFFWFDIAQRGDVMHQDWRIEDSAAALAAYRGAVSRIATPVR